MNGTKVLSNRDGNWCTIKPIMVWGCIILRKSIGALLALAVVFAMAAVPGSADSTRLVMISGSPEALHTARGLAKARFELPTGFSAEVTESVARRLEKLGLKVEQVGTASLLGKPVGTSGTRKGKPGSGGRAAAPEDTTPWGIESVYNDQSISSTSGGNGMIVAVLDTGVASHLDLKKPLRCADFSGRRGMVEGSCLDKNGHGTHVTGTILANGGADGQGIWGVAPEADYFAYKVVADNGRASWDGVAAAIRSAADSGANIITMSLGGSGVPDFVRDAIVYAGQKGALVIAAAGNSGSGPDSIQYPAAYAEAVAVAALEMIDGGNGSGDSTSLNNLRIAGYSSRGAAASSGQDGINEREVEVAAPGTYVESTARDGAYVKYSGTSMAAPHIAGLAAREWQGNAASTRQWLQNQAERYDTTQADGGGAGNGYDYASGFGAPRVN